jgi:hypothetical protein
MMCSKDSDLLYQEMEKPQGFEREKNYDETIEEC